jgi:hypothetical protein
MNAQAFKKMEVEAKQAFTTWSDKQTSGLRTVFLNYCNDTGTKNTDKNFDEFQFLFFFECKAGFKFRALLEK